MIISASRRTDIPAWYSQWFMNRIREGWCAVPNPMNMNQVKSVSLNPRSVEAIVFWSKNPKPMMNHLDELKNMGYHYYFQFTLNDYPPEFEPNVPNLEDRINTFKELSRKIGWMSVVWRYDPIIISNMTDYAFHLDKFSTLAEELHGVTKRVVVSIIDYYQKTDRRLSKLEDEGFNFEREADQSKKMEDFLKQIAGIATRHDMEIYSCAEECDYSFVGVPPGSCIDQALINNLWGFNIPYEKDKYQRKACMCHKSTDIGINDTCIHGCRYCYSTRSLEMAERRHNEHDPNSPVLWWPPNKPLAIGKENKAQQRLL